MFLSGGMAPLAMGTLRSERVVAARPVIQLFAFHIYRRCRKRGEVGPHQKFPRVRVCFCVSTVLAFVRVCSPGGRAARRSARQGSLPRSSARRVRVLLIGVLARVLSRGVVLVGVLAREFWTPLCSPGGVATVKSSANQPLQPALYVQPNRLYILLPPSKKFLPL